MGTHSDNRSSQLLNYGSKSGTARYVNSSVVVLSEGFLPERQPPSDSGHTLSLNSYAQMPTRGLCFGHSRHHWTSPLPCLYNALDFLPDDGEVRTPATSHFLSLPRAHYAHASASSTKTGSRYLTLCSNFHGTPFHFVLFNFLARY